MTRRLERRLEALENDAEPDIGFADVVVANLQLEYGAGEQVDPDVREWLESETDDSACTDASGTDLHDHVAALRRDRL